jgi:hypothetical protein
VGETGTPHRAASSTGGLRQPGRIRAAVGPTAQRTEPGHEVEGLVGGVSVEVEVGEVVDEAVGHQGAGLVIALFEDPLDDTEHRREDLCLVAAEQVDEVPRDLPDAEVVTVALVGVGRMARTRVAGAGRHQQGVDVAVADHGHAPAEVGPTGGHVLGARCEAVTARRCAP